MLVIGVVGICGDDEVELSVVGVVGKDTLLELGAILGDEIRRLVDDQADIRRGVDDADRARVGGHRSGG